jgi:hypothetical protein
MLGFLLAEEADQDLVPAAKPHLVLGSRLSKVESATLSLLAF